jgi:peptide chain release factor 2
MLEKYLTNKKIKYKIIEKTDYLIQIEAFAEIGFLDFFIGIIKLVRVSPFGKGDKVHTSFAKVSVEEQHKKEKIVILDKDLDWDFFKSTGPGGQHKNKTMTAVRLIHKPTNTTVISSNERSQLENKRKALEQMEIELEKQQANKLNQNKKASWENSIKPEDANISFYFNNQLVCNEKTGTKTRKLKDVLNGNLDLLTE